MKRISVIVLGMVICSFANINAQNDVQKQLLKGKVRTVTYYSGKDTGQISMFNNLGNIVEERYYMEGKVVDICRYTYDAWERLAETNSVSWRTVYSYDKNNFLTDTRRYKIEDGTLMQRCLFYYGSQGNESKEISYSGSGHLLYRSVITTEANGDRKEVYYDADGKMERDLECRFDANHLPVSSMQCTIHSGIKSTDNNEFHYYTFDAAGNWTGRAAIVNSVEERYNYSSAYTDTCQRVIEYY